MLLVVDAAYAEYVDLPDYKSGLDMVKAHDNVVMTRTFSKIFGLAALRLGWAYCPPAVADVLNRIRGPFNVPAPAQAAGVTALADREHLGKAKAHNDRWLPWFAQRMRALGLHPYPSVANFVLVKFPSDPKLNAEAALKFLNDRRILPRRVGGLRPARLPACHHRGRSSGQGLRRRARSLREGSGDAMSAPTPNPMFDKIAIIGIGLIGSSIARAARKHKLAKHISIANSSEEARKIAAELKLGESVHADPGEAAKDADLTLVCVPIGAYAEVGQAHRPAPEGGQHPHRRRLGEAGGAARPRRRWCRSTCISFPAIRSPAPSIPARRRASPNCSTAAGPS